MSNNNKLFEAATQLSKTFMPAERAQNSAAIQATKSLVAALEARSLPEFSNAACDAALESLLRGISLAVEADTALRQAHRRFAKVVGHTNLPELGWGCQGCVDEVPGGALNVEPIRAAA